MNSIPAVPSTQDTHSRLLRWTARLAALLLVITLGSVCYGHMGGSEQGLSLTGSYVTEYVKSAPHWPWLVVSCFSFAVLLSLLAFGFLLRQQPPAPLTTLGCMLISAASMGVFFVAYAPVRRVEQPPPEPLSWWTPQWWFTSHTARSPYENGMADAYSDVHYHAITLVLTTGLTGMLLLGAGHRFIPGKRRFARFTMAASVLMAVLFLLGDHLASNHGLWQRLGFAVMYLWLWSAQRQLTVQPGVTLPQSSRPAAHP